MARNYDESEEFIVGEANSHCGTANFTIGVQKTLRQRHEPTVVIALERQNAPLFFYFP